MQQEKVHLSDYSLQKYKEYNSKFNTASTTVEELKENLENCIRSRVSLKKELKQYSLSNLRGLLVLSEVFINNEEYFNEDLKIPNYAGSSKEVVINQLYKSMLKYFCLGRNLDDSGGSNDITESRLIEIVRKAISSLTEIDLREMARKVNLYRTFLNKALNKPKTKAEFIFFISYKGKNSLDPVQKILWNNLLTNAKSTNYQINQQVKGDSMSSTTTTIATSQTNVLASFNKEKASQVSKSSKSSNINNTSITSKKEKNVNLNALEKAANTLAKKSEAILSKDRLRNTVRRANIAENVESNARKELRLAKTILNLVKAIKLEQSEYLAGIKYRSQVQVLEYLLRAAKGTRSRKLKHCDWIDKDRELEIEDIEFVRYPYPCTPRDSFKRLTLLCQKVDELNGFAVELNVHFGLELKKDDSENLYFNSKEKTDLLRNIINALKGIDHSVTKSMADFLSYQSQDFETLQHLGIYNLSILKEALKEYFQYRSNSDFAERELLTIAEEESVNSSTLESSLLVNEVVANNLLQEAETITKQVESILAQEIEPKTYEDVEKAKSVDFDVRKQLQLAKTIVKIAKAIEFSQTHLLSTIKEKDDIELLENLLQDAKYRRPKEIGKDLDNCDPESTDLDRVMYPYPRISKLMLEKVFKITSIEPLNVVTSRVKKLLTPQVRYDGVLIFKEPSEIKDYEEIVNLVKTVDSWLAEMLLVNQQLAYHKRLQSLGLTDLPTLIEALKEYLALREELPKIEPVKAMQLSLLRWAIDGYFYTPKAVVTRMLDLAGIKPNTKILNACAGAGNIADGIRDRYPNANISVIEISSELREVLVVKGHNLVASDIFKHEENYDYILMFSPFKHHYDITCFYQAYHLLVTGGKLVSIISEESFSSNFDYSIGFRKWLKALGATTEQLPEGILIDKHTGKGINARIVIIDKYSLF